MMARYNHVYDMAFSVVSDTPDGSDVTQAMLRAALFKRIHDIDAEAEFGGMEQACGGPYDTYEED
jgi:hypothetical protein